MIRCINRLEEHQAGLVLVERFRDVAIGEVEVRGAGEDRRPTDDAQRAVASGYETGLLGKLAPGALERILARVGRSRGHLPRRCVPRVPPLADEHRVAVVEVRDDESRVRVRQDRVERLRPVGKADHVPAQRERARFTRDRGGLDLERPAGGWVREPSQCFCTTTATAAAAAAMWRGSGP